MKVCYCGNYGDHTGYGEANRNFIAALDHAGVEVTTQRVAHVHEVTNLGWMENLCNKLEGKHRDYEVKIIHLTPDIYPDYMEAGKYHIGHLFWETDRLPEAWVPHCNNMNEIWTASNPMAYTLRKSGVTVPIYAFPQPIELTDKMPKPMSIPDAPDFLFYSIFQWTPRKNPAALLEAYWKAFEGNNNVGLLLKTFRLDYGAIENVYIQQDIQHWKNEIGQESYPWIKVYNQLMTRSQINQFHVTGNVFVLPHTGEGWCHIPGTSIVTRSGLRDIEDCDGIDVLTHRGRFKKAKLLQREYAGEVIKITPYYTNPVVITPNHNVAVIKRNGADGFSPKFRNQNYQWVPASEVEKGDLVCIPRLKHQSLVTLNITDYVEGLRLKEGYVFKTGRNQFGSEYDHPTGHSISNKIEIDEDFLWLCGLFLAEGSTGRGKSVTLSLDKRKENLKDKVMQISQSKFGIEPYIEVMERNRTNVVINSVILGNLFMELFGTGAKNKKIPEMFMDLPNNLVKSLIVGMWSGDGSVYANCGNVIEGSYSTVSQTLAWQFYLCINRFTKDPISINTKPRKDTATEYQIIVSGNNNTHALDFIFDVELEQRVNRKNGWGAEDYLYFTVRSVDRTHYSGTVYNLTVEEDETYVNEGFLVHNCRPVVEALGFHKPVISTNLGGVHDYLSPDMYYPLSYEMADILEVSWVKYYEKGQKWGEIDIDDLAERMLYVYRNQDDAEYRTRLGREFIRKNFSLERVGRLMRERLERLT